MSRKLSVSEPDIDELCQLYLHGWSSLKLANYYRISKPSILRRLRFAGIERRDVRIRGPMHPNWITGKIIDKNGYVKVNVGGGKRVFEHKLIMEQHLLRKLIRKEEIHHTNGNKQDNRIENLELCEDRADHKRKHQQYDWSTNYPCCQKCGRTNRKHDSYGLCINCSSLARYHRRKNSEK